MPSINEDVVEKQVEKAPLRILVVAEHTSTRFGGEAILPWHYFRVLRERGIEAWLVTHERTRDELLGLLPSDAGRMYFVPDTEFAKFACRLSRFIPSQLSYVTVGYASRIQSQLDARRLVRRLIKEKGIDVVHQPIPVSPREPSLMYDLGVPVVIGPMNGNMSYPPAFVRKDLKLLAMKGIISFARAITFSLHLLMPGKLRAAALLAANERTKIAVPSGARGEVSIMVENGVDLDVWSPPDRDPPAEGPIRFVFLGRLVDWKAVDLLLEAFARIEASFPPQLEIIGDGVMRPALQAQVSRLGLEDRVRFAGWQPQAECARQLRLADALVLPSLYECGGAVVLEAMACGLPVIATEWGGPTDYLDASCGILVPPSSRDALIGGFADAMSRLAANPTLRATLGRAGRERVVREFNWEHKVDEMLTIYRRVAERRMSTEESTAAQVR
jgi:glycosyltransferase involved in cell wall biosynthesis